MRENRVKGHTQTENEGAELLEVVKDRERDGERPHGLLGVDVDRAGRSCDVLVEADELSGLARRAADVREAEDLFAPKLSSARELCWPRDFRAHLLDHLHHRDVDDGRAEAGVHAVAEEVVRGRVADLDLLGFGEGGRVLEAEEIVSAHRQASQKTDHAPCRP